MIHMGDTSPRIDTETLTLKVMNTQPEHVPALAALQRVVFPTLDAEELFTEAKYYKHIELFPEGQFVALLERDGEWLPIGATSTYRTNFDFDHIQHTYTEAIADGWLTHHDPHGEWLYGVDVSVHPEYRGLKVGRRLYEARREFVNLVNLRGEIAGALIPGYHQHAQALSAAQYVLRVWQGKLHDPTLSMQLRNDFKIKGILYDHISDPRSVNTATLIVRENTHYQPAAAIAATRLDAHTHKGPHSAHKPPPQPQFGSHHGTHFASAGRQNPPGIKKPSGLSPSAFTGI